MAEYIGREDGGSNSASREVAVASGATVNDGDFVTLSGGRATAASIAKKRILGFVQGGDSRKIARTQRTTTSGKSATGDAAGTVKVIVNQEPSARYLIKAASGSFAATDEGKYFNLEGNTGAQVVTNTPAADIGQLILVKAAPGIRGTDASYGIFRIADGYEDSTAAIA